MHAPLGPALSSLLNETAGHASQEAPGAMRNSPRQTGGADRAFDGKKHMQVNKKNPDICAAEEEQDVEEESAAGG